MTIAQLFQGQSDKKLLLREEKSQGKAAEFDICWVILDDKNTVPKNSLKNNQWTHSSPKNSRCSYFSKQNKKHNFARVW